MMNWNNAYSTGFTCNTQSNAMADTSTYNITFSDPDPLIDWLPNCCLYIKYVPIWHLIRSYK